MNSCWRSIVALGRDATMTVCIQSLELIWHSSKWARAEAQATYNIYIFFFSFSIFLWQKFRVPVNDDSFEWLYNKQQIQQQQQKQSLFRISDMYPIAPQAGTSTPKHNKSQYRRYSRVRSFCVFPNRSEWKLIIMLWKSCCDVVCFCVRILVSFILFGNCLLYQYDM